MSQMTIPATRPEWLETEDHFIPSETATACRYCRAYALLRMKMSPAYRGKDSRIITIRVSMLNAITCNVIQV